MQNAKFRTEPPSSILGKFCLNFNFEHPQSPLLEFASVCCADCFLTHDAAVGVAYL